MSELPDNNDNFSEDEIRVIEESIRDIKEGRFKRFKNVNDLLDDLHSTENDQK